MDCYRVKIEYQEDIAYFDLFLVLNNEYYTNVIFRLLFIIW